MIATCTLLMLVVSGAGALIAGAFGKNTARWVGLLAAATVTVLAVFVATSTMGVDFRESLGGLPWIPELSGGLFGLLVDPLSAVLLLVAAPIGLLTVLFSFHYMTEKNRDHAVGAPEQGAYYFWLLLFLGSMIGIAVSPNFLQLFIFWELTTFCSWALISFYQTDKSLHSGFKALVITHVGGLFFLVAILILFVFTRSFEFNAIAQLPENVRPWVFFFIMIAAWAKAGQVPFHTWLPDAMEAPTPISAYLHAAAMVKAGVFLLARTASAGWAISPALGYVLGAMALLTLFVALSYYFVQDDLKRLLAYSTIAHLAYVFLGIALGVLGSSLAYQGAVLHIVCHGFGKATLFFCAGAIAYVTGSRSISAVGGLGRTMPLTAVAFVGGDGSPAFCRVLEQVHDIFWCVAAW
jgi:hydrogenase-4 component D